MSEQIQPTTEALREALQLSEDLLRNVELSEMPLANICLKASRLARLLNEFDFQKAFEYEAGGYPSAPGGIKPDVWRIALLAGRKYEKEVKGEVKPYAYLESIEQLESQIEAAKLGLDAARDPNVSLSSANPHQHLMASNNSGERFRLHGEMKESVKRLAARRSFIHAYALQKHLELRYSGIASDAFSRIREFVDSRIGDTAPASIQKFTAIYDNLQSENPEDWSNAVHGCRRVLQDLADSVFPAQDESRTKEIGGKKIQIKLGADQYINRLICFAEDRSSSTRSSEIIGSQMTYLGDRLDALFQAAQKGSHSVISTRDEADRYVVYTYMIVGDLLRLNVIAEPGLPNPPLNSDPGASAWAG